jgi:hypothetical protein
MGVSARVCAVEVESKARNVILAIEHFPGFRKAVGGRQETFLPRCSSKFRQGNQSLGGSKCIVQVVFVIT